MRWQSRVWHWQISALSFCLGIAAIARAEMPPQPNAGASLIVEGVVRETFRSVRTTTVDYVFLLEVRAAKAGNKPEFPYSGPLPKRGDALYVYAFQRTPDAPQIPGPVGYRSLPAEGSVIMAFLYPRGGSAWQFAYPVGFETVGRAAADDLSPLSAQPARAMPLEAIVVPPVVVPPVVVAPPRRLGVQVTPVVISDQRGLRITNVLPASPAARAGLVPGDVILKAAGLATGEASVLTDRVVNSGPRLPLFVRHAASGLEDTVEIDFAPLP